MELEARCDQCEAMLRDAIERSQQGRGKLESYRATQRKVSVRWH